MYDPDKRKLLSILCHASVFFAALILFIGLPLGIFFLVEDPVVKATAKEVLNFHLNIWLYGVIIGPLCFILAVTIIGIPLAWLLGALFLLFHWITPIFAILKSLNQPDEPYRYPFIFRVL
ncbi:DUF4870 domain-containing protein [Oscillatoria sp. FACHB-1406]|uniref:DUF4870 domain-containing protein n=1 Tax=Oscillatoria sp. FACHB-1406 TaxID=2692846 RepID=UPI001684696D|nr:DUF4870 domain-containing protein [Oscillatoria sp. FACHB-1406]MBD2577439.1 DUF4870 domain-containing protein [Oscillatoria sp. FACHB-1406]